MGGLRLWGYVHNPITWIDPLGLAGGPPPNLTPQGAGRRVAFRETKRDSGIPVSQQPVDIRPNIDNQGNPQFGKQYVFKNDKGEGVIIRDDAGGHIYSEKPDHDRGRHFNDPNDGHYDYKGDTYPYKDQHKLPEKEILRQANNMKLATQQN